MKVMFNGTIERTSSSGKGCNCGKKNATGYTFQNSKLYHLPSGATKTFYAGKVEEVSDSDGYFLLSYRSFDQNGEHATFTKVED